MKNAVIVSLLLLVGHLVQGQEILLLKTSGKVVIGDTTLISTPGNYNLYVQNGILTERVKVALKSSTDWADHAFAEVPSCEEMDDHIKANSHLIGMPSASDLVSNGYELKEMDAKLLQQIEWLWMHVIELEKENKALRLALLQANQK